MYVYLKASAPYMGSDYNPKTGTHWVCKGKVVEVVLDTGEYVSVESFLRAFPDLLVPDVLNRDHPIRVEWENGFCNLYDISDLVFCDNDSNLGGCKSIW